eukprot:TRINITY_DN692_c0_g1_i2.p1 TRINITY_DN692_c0_g1~~TRINITY_DN692_c0_g1_i2.p1  ORF type:complete len:353 (+),score=91.65 TRINITY_DN692_c0_g1_i2:135-1193(+)
MLSSSTSAGFNKKAIISVVAFISLNVILQIWNKYLFAVKEFRFPLLIIITGTLITFIGSVLCIFLFRLVTVPYGAIAENWRLLFLVSMCSGLGTGLENLSISYISISLNQVVKATAPAGTLIYAKFFEGKQFSHQLIISTIILVLGAIMTVFRNPDFNWVGFVLTFASLFFGVAQSIGTGMLLQRSESIGVLVIIFVTSLPAVVALVPLFFLLEYNHLLVSHAQSGIGGDTAVILTLLAMGGTAFTYQMAHYYLIEHTSAHYSMIIGNVKVVAVTLMSMVFFGSKFSPLNALGLAVSLCAFCAYNFFRFREQRQAETLRNSRFTEEVGVLMSKIRSRGLDSTSDSDEDPTRV